MTQTKERGILFSAPMVRAILNSTKTMTRRILKPQPTWHNASHPQMIGDTAVFGVITDDFPKMNWKCPYGAPGSRLWVRETWCPRSGGMLAMDSICRPRYRADGELRPEWGFKWKSALYMPRNMSRITLEVESVRVERVQDITHKDALAEGVQYDVSKPDGAPVPRFRQLWESIHGAGAWARNDWCWCISFKVLSPEAP